MDRLLGFDFAQLKQQTRHGIRGLLRDRAFAAVSIVTLALGIGANTAVFSLVKAALLSPLPYGDADRLMAIWGPDRGEATHLSLREIHTYGQEAQSFLAVAGYQEFDASFTGGQEPELIRAGSATPNLFEVTRAAAMIGRIFTTSDTAAGTSDVVVISHGLWQRRFGGAADIIGSSVQMNGRARTVIGVMPPSFRLPNDYASLRPTEAWVPEVVDPANLGAWGNRSYSGLARLKDDVAAATASSELPVIAARWVKAGHVRSQADGSLGALARRVIPAHDFIVGEVRGTLVILFGAVAFVLLIACANVANLQLARADARRRDVAVRAALGADRRDIVSQLLTESVLLSVAGAAAGLAVAWAGLQIVITLRPANLPRLDETTLDITVLAFTAGLAIVTGILFGTLPALQMSRPDVTGVLKDGGRTGTAGRSRQLARRGLVILQLASSVVLAMAAGLLIRSLVELNRIDLGFNPANVLTAQVQVPATDYPQPADVVRFHRQVVERVSQIPGVLAAGSVRVLPLARIIGDWSIKIEGRPYVPEENPNGDYQAVTPGYFEAMGMRLVRGRFLTDADREDTMPAVVINETMAARYWPNEDAVGRQFIMGTDDKPWLTIVGIVGNVRHNAIVEAPRAEFYVAHAQLPGHIRSAPRGMTLVLKTDPSAASREGAGPLALTGQLRDAIRSIDRNLPVAVQTMDSVAAAALSQPRFITFLLALFAATALTLAAIGIYGTISLLVAERTQEMGIRLALGANPPAILKLVMSQGLMLTAIGLSIGLAGAAVLTRTLSGLIYGVGTLDPMTFVAVPVLLAAVALLACLLPAQRAASVDPITTLRQG
ncbi:MAG TPA: ABC transporter permease [Vicinamibacterales bacterium]|nr:ABC transporter permease [Vicinamibacterales bacterium]